MSRLNVILVIAVIIGAVILSSFGSSAMQKLQAGFLSAVSPFLKTGSAVQRQLGAMGEGLKTLDQLEDENKRLKTGEQGASRRRTRFSEISRQRIASCVPHSTTESAPSSSFYPRA